MLLALASILSAQAGTLDLDVELSSAYVWRGANVFATRSPSQQVPLLAPSVTYSEGAWWVGYWSAYALGAGPALVDAGVSAEQDLLLGYDLDLSEGVEATLSLTAYGYPLADAATSIGRVPLWMEPALSLTWPGEVEYALTLSWFQDMQALRGGYSFAYLEPSLSTAVPLLGELELELGAEAGLKLYTGAGGPWGENAVHVAVHSGVTVPLLRSLYLQPGLHVAWTNTDAGWGQGLAPWGGVHLGCSL